MVYAAGTPVGAAAPEPYCAIICLSLWEAVLTRIKSSGTHEVFFIT